MIFQFAKISTVTAVMKDLCRKTEKIRSEPAICVSEITVGTAMLQSLVVSIPNDTAPTATFTGTPKYNPDLQWLPILMKRYARLPKTRSFRSSFPPGRRPFQKVLPHAPIRPMPLPYLKEVSIHSATSVHW